MIGRTALATAVLGATLLAACGDAVVPLAPDTVSPPALSEGLKSWQCSSATGVVAVEVAEGADAATVVAAPEGHVVTQVAIKVGTDCLPTPAGAAGAYTIHVAGMPCALVEGLGAASVTVTRVGESPECKNITHVEYVSVPAPQTGLLQICVAFAVFSGSPYFLVHPVTLAVAGTTLTFGAANTYVPPVVCAEPIDLPAGEHAITPLPPYSGLGVTVSDDRLVSRDPATGTAVVLVVVGSPTVVTFQVGGDHND